LNLFDAAFTMAKLLSLFSKAMSMPHAPVIRTLLLASLSTAALAACGTTGGSASGESSQKSQAPMPPITEMDAAMAAPASATPLQAKPLPLNGSDTLTPVLPAGGGTAAAPAGETAPPSMDERLAKLEISVNALRSDYDRIMPAFASLNTTNERIQQLLDEMETQGKIPAAEPVAAATATAPAAEPAAAPTPASAPAPASAPVPTPAKAAAAGSFTVKGLRIGEHASKTRLVVDLGAAAVKPSYTYDLDNGEKLLVVDLPGGSWAGAREGKPNSPLIAGWSAQDKAGGGATMAVQLKKNTRVLMSEYLKAEGKDPARLVIDIAAQ
jgi:TolA-binding protein